MPHPSTSLFPQTSGLYPGDGTEIAPTVTTGSGSNIAPTTAFLGGTVNPNGLQTHYYFEYGLTESYGSTSSEGIAGNGSSPVAALLPVTGLTSARLYHFRIVAYSGAGFSYGADATFFTDFGPHDPRPHPPHGAGRGQ